MQKMVVGRCKTEQSEGYLQPSSGTNTENLSYLYSWKQSLGIFIILGHSIIELQDAPA